MAGGGVSPGAQDVQRPGSWARGGSVLHVPPVPANVSQCEGRSEPGHSARKASTWSPKEMATNCRLRLTSWETYGQTGHVTGPRVFF